MLQLTCAAPSTPPPELAEAYTSIVPTMAGICGDIGYHPLGHPVLRAAIAERYTRHGIRTGPDRILVTNGAQQAGDRPARAAAGRARPRREHPRSAGRRLLPRLEPLSQRRATELKARHDHLRAELAAIFPRPRCGTARKRA